MYQKLVLNSDTLFLGSVCVYVCVGGLNVKFQCGGKENEILDQPSIIFSRGPVAHICIKLGGPQLIYMIIQEKEHLNSNVIKLSIQLSIKLNNIAKLTISFQRLNVCRRKNVIKHF